MGIQVTKELMAAPGGLGIPEAIREVRDMQRKALAPTIVDLPECEPDRRYGVFNPHDGTLTFREAAAYPRYYKASTLEGFADLVADIHLRKQDDESTLLFVGRDEVRAVFDEGGDRLDSVWLPLERSAQMNMIEVKFRSVTQKQLCRDLRVHFHNMTDPVDLARVFSSIKITKRDDVQSTTRGNEESMGASIERRAALPDGADLLTEAVLDAPLFTTICGIPGMEGEPDNPFLARISCAVEIDFETGMFGLTPRSGEVEDAYANAINAMTVWLRERFSDQLDQGRFAIANGAQFLQAYDD